MAYDHNKYTSQYEKDNYDRIVFKVPKGKKNILRHIAEEHDFRDGKGMISVSRAIVDALEKTYHVDLTKPD